MVLKSTFPDVVIPQVPLGLYILESMKVHNQDATAMVDDGSGKVLTLADVREQSMRCAAALHKLGLQKGDVVAMCSPNCADYIIIVIGAWCCGAIITTCNPQYTPVEITAQLTHSEPKFVFFDSCHAEKMKVVKDSVNSIQELFTIKKNAEFKSATDLIDGVSDKDFPEVQLSVDDVTLLPYSSGTTGTPKGVMLTSQNINAIINICRISLHLSTLDVLYLILPQFHIYGILFTLLSLCQGSTIVLDRRFDLEGLFIAIEKHRVTYFLAVPPILVAMDKTTISSKYDTSSLKQVLSGAAPLPSGVALSVTKKFGFHIVQAWGMTEGVPATASVSQVYPMKSVGVVVPNTQLKVIDVETQDEVGPNQDGELCMKGPQVMKGYYKNPTATAECIDTDGWLHTGDIGHYDKKGFVFVIDRLKELIKVKGFQVAPAELEETLLRHPKIADAGVIGVSDSEAGELPKAFIVKKDQTLTEEQVHDYMKGQLSKFKLLKGGVEFLSSIPKTASGKILRRQLREMENINPRS